MQRLNIDEIPGTVINQGINQREVKLLASPNSQISREGFALGVTIVGAGKIHEEHAHDQNEEIVVILQGKGTAFIGGNEITVKTGDVLGINKLEGHKFINTDTSELQLLWIYSPPGVAEEKFLRR